ncbi:MAG: enoyl-ACP reductase [Acidobacteriota bacterium]|nr:enoyl-ACP reductase [Acidobacteriota bacterium]MDP9122366.1 enoyl-ACP reductase [Acidobacteriota bacterium]
MIDLKGKVAVVFGLANKRSIAYAVAQKLAEAGATLILSYQSERLQRESEQLLADLGQSETGRAFQCDVSRDEEIDALFSKIANAVPKIDIVIHSVAFAPPAALHNDFLHTTRADFAVALDVSVYSLIAVARGAAPLMTEGGAMLTLTHFGSTVTFPNYNVMGVAKAGLEAAVRYLAGSLGAKNIRVNAISAGAIKTLAARGIGDLQTMLDRTTERAPLHRNVDQIEVGNTAAFLCSPLASAITGEITFVDCGFNTTGI